MRVPVVCFSMLFLFTPAARGQFMKPGSSPEAGFAGTWRVVDSTPAPWTHATERSRAKTPLLEFAVQFSDGAVKGPAALACEHALYSSGVSSLDDLFEGNLKTSGADALAKQLGLADFSVTTYRVVCGDKTRDYYVGAKGDLKTYESGIVYTLERPTGMEPAQYQPGFSGPSFDCAKAKSASERTICRDAALSKSDSKLNAAYRRLKTSMTPASFATVQSAQRDWLAYVANSCGADGPMPADQGERNNLEGCLEDNYTDRAERLANAEVVKTGALVLEPRMRLFTRTSPDTEESDIYPWMGGGPEADPFNAYVAKALKLAKRRMDDKELFPFGDDVADMKLSARRTYAVHRFDAHVVSLQVSTYDYTGGAHEAIGETSLTWDLARAKPVTLDDVFVAGKPWRIFVTDFCMKDLHDQFAGMGEPAPDRSAVEGIIGDGGNWLWGTDKATVHFTVYAVASFAAGEFDVDIPYAELKPYLRSDAPVLP